MNTYVNFETAKLLKEKGFDVECTHHYEYALTSRKDVEQGHTGAFGWKKGECNLQSGFFINNYPGIDLSNKSWYLCSAPTIAEVVMWLYEKHKIWIEVRKHTRDMLLCFSPYIDNTPINSDVFFNDYDSPTEAYEAGIEHTLKHLI